MAEFHDEPAGGAVVDVVGDALEERFGDVGVEGLGGEEVEEGELGGRVGDEAADVADGEAGIDG